MKNAFEHFIKKLIYLAYLFKCYACVNELTGFDLLYGLFIYL